MAHGHHHHVDTATLSLERRQKLQLDTVSKARNPPWRTLGSRVTEALVSVEH